MNPNLLFPIGIFLGLGLLGMAGATKPLQQVQLWLDQHDSPHTAAASFGCSCSNTGEANSFV